jgi:hypothetical protein
VTTTVLLLLIGMASARVVSVVRLMVRLRWQVERDRLRQDTLTMLAARLPTTATIELDEVGASGRVRVRVTTVGQGERENDVRT